MANMVKMNLKQDIPIQNVDVQFEVRSNGVYLGELKLSRGGVGWHKAHAHGDDQHVTWRKFADWIESQ